MKNSRKNLALLLVTVMLLGMFGVSAMAVTPPSSTITIPVVYYDFSVPAAGVPSNPDFERNPISGLKTGLVKSTLGVDGTPDFLSEQGSITAASFENWYKYQAPSGANPGNKEITGQSLTLSLKAGTTDVYGFSDVRRTGDDGFFPICNLGFGNENRVHNYHFTMKLSTNFTYVAGQKFSFTGDDDVWVFIDKKLVVDLGGVHTSETGSVNLDTLGLTPGSTYDFDLFFAERHTTDSNFAMETSIKLNPVEKETYDLTVAANPVAGGTTTGSGPYEECVLANIGAAANNGYHFVSWTGTGITAAGSSSTTVLMDADKTVTANFELNDYTVEASAVNGSAAVSPLSGPYHFGDAVTVTATPGNEPGYTYAFEGWYKDGSPTKIEGAAEAYPFTVDASVVLLAKYTKTQNPAPTPGPTPEPTTEPTPSPEPSTEPTPSPAPDPTPVPKSPVSNVILDLTVAGPGTVSPGSGAYGVNSLIYFTVTPDAGAEFLGWTGPDGSAVSAENVLLMSQARTVTANFGVLEVITETVVPEAPVKTTLETAVLESAPVIEEITTDEMIPQAAPVLPKTGGIPMGLLSGIGALLTASGLVIGRRKKEEK
jgi:fibro-slime domain-containing protein/LPXTG-motif cell wall-anchored protein